MQSDACVQLGLVNDGLGIHWILVWAVGQYTDGMLADKVTVDKVRSFRQETRSLCAVWPPYVEMALVYVMVIE